MLRTVLLPAKPMLYGKRPTRETLRLLLKRFAIALAIMSACSFIIARLFTFDVDFRKVFDIERFSGKLERDITMMFSDRQSKVFVREEDIVDVDYERPSDAVNAGKTRDSSRWTISEAQDEGVREDDDAVIDDRNEEEGKVYAEEKIGEEEDERRANEGSLASEGKEEGEEEEEERLPRQQEEDGRRANEGSLASEGKEEEEERGLPRQRPAQVVQTTRIEKDQSFAEFAEKDLEDVKRFDYMMQKRDGSIGISERTCELVKKYYKDELKPRYENLRENKIVIIDWSGNYQNGIGDEMQHYQEMFIIGISTGRAAFVKTQKDTCEGLGISEGDEIPFNAGTYEELAKKCQFDLGDYFIGYEGVDWKWDKGKRRRAKKEIFDDGDFEETVFSWGQNGAYIGDQSPSTYKGGYYAKSDDNSVVKTMEHPKFQAAKVARIKIHTNFGHWCHPTKLTDFGICLSFRWATNFENNYTESKCGPACGVGSCFGTQMLTPRKHLKIAMLPAFEEMSKRGWKQIVGAHIRTGFADMSQIEPPTNIARKVKQASLESVDDLLSLERTKRVYPEPNCPIRNAANKMSWAPEREEGMEDPPLTLLLRCLSDLMRDVRSKESDPLGLFFTTDSPAINAVMHSSEALQLLRVNASEVLSTVGSFGNVKFSNTGICDGSSESCVASDPRSAWLKSMVDLTLLGECDVQILLYSSKFADASLMRSVKTRRGRTHFYENTRITHQLIDPLVQRIQRNTNKEDWEMWGLLWDNFGPSGDRSNIDFSALAKKHGRPIN